MSVLAAFSVPHPPIILPEVGHGEEKKIQKTIDAYRAVMRRAAELRPDTVVLISPHAPLYADYFHLSSGGTARGNLRQFGAGDVRLEVPCDTQFVRELTRRARSEEIPAGTLDGWERDLDHGTLIPLRFLEEVFTGYRLVRIGLSGLPPLQHYRLGQCVAQTAEALSRRVILLASGDLSHKLTSGGPYGFAPEGPEFDRRLTEALARGDFLELLRFPPIFTEAAAECGLRSFQIMAGALDGKAVKSELLSYEGPFGVGYGVASFLVTGDDPSRRFGQRYEEDRQQQLKTQQTDEDAYVRLARLSLETYVKNRARAKLPDGLPQELLTTRAGAFVSLKKHGRLRGCIGTIAPTTNSVAEEILQNAVSAGAEDPRFLPVAPEELKDLTYSVDVLGEPEDIDSPADLDVKRYGVIVRCGARRGLLLPNLDGVNTVEQQLDIARQKAGIPARESLTLQRFEVVRHT